MMTSIIRWPVLLRKNCRLQCDVFLRPNCFSQVVRFRSAAGNQDVGQQIPRRGNPAERMGIVGTSLRPMAVGFVNSKSFRACSLSDSVSSLFAKVEGNHLDVKETSSRVDMEALHELIDYLWQQKKAFSAEQRVQVLLGLAFIGPVSDNAQQLVKFLLEKIPQDQLAALDIHRFRSLSVRLSGNFPGPLTALLLQMVSRCSDGWKDGRLGDALEILGTLMAYGQASRELTTHLSDRLASEISHMEDRDVGFCALVLRRYDMPIGFNPWQRIDKYLQSGEASQDVHDLLMYASSSNQITIPDWQRLQSSLAIDAFSPSNIVSLVGRFGRHRPMHIFTEHIQPLLLKFLPVVEKHIEADNFTIFNYTVMLRANNFFNASIDWLRILIPAIVERIEQVDEAELSFALFSLGKAPYWSTSRDLTKLACRLLDAYTVRPFDASKMSSNAMRNFCMGCSALGIRHSPYLYAIAHSLVERKAELHTMRPQHLSGIIHALGLLNFRHPELLSTVTELIDSGALDVTSWDPKHLVNLSWACVHGRQYPTGLLKATLEIPAHHRNNLSYSKVSDLLQLASVLKYSPVAGVAEPAPEWWLHVAGIANHRSKSLHGPVPVTPKERLAKHRGLDVIQSILPHPSFLLRNPSVSHVELDGALILDERHWPISWKDSQLHPSDINRSSLAAFNQTAVAIFFPRPTDTLGDGMKTLSGRTSMAYDILSSAGWRVVSLPLASHAWLEGGAALEQINEALAECGVVLPSSTLPPPQSEPVRGKR